jgi:hypothetical protein
MRQVKSEEVDLALDTTDDADGFTEVCLHALNGDGPRLAPS